MRLIARTLRPAVGVLVIAHGWAHAVLPLRGFVPAEYLGGQSLMPMIGYGVALFGFSAAGVGILGVSPFTLATRPLLMLASMYSLVSLAILGHHDLWWGSAFDVVLLLAGAIGLIDRLPRLATRVGPLRQGLRTAAAVAFLCYTASAVMWPVYREWGSTDVEHALTLPGDEPGRQPALEIQHGVTVDAPPSAVWPWLVQLGQDRGGFYSYDWLERAFGVDVRNVNEIRPEWQPRRVGELLPATQAGYLGGVFGTRPGWIVEDVVPGRALVLQYWGAFALVPADGATTRFIIRTRIGDERIPVWAATLDMMTFQLPHFIMERRMMLNIKRLAETSAKAS